MPTQIRFLGVAGYEIITSQQKHILIDPFLDDCPGAPFMSDALAQVDLILVSHAAFDHLGDTEKIARRTGAPVVCGGDVKQYLKARGIPGTQIQATVWGIVIDVAGFRVQPVECHHWSQIQLPNGQFISGVPMGFVIEPDPGIRFYHYGDTAIFSDLKLIGELYRPTIGAIGITNPIEVSRTVEGPGRLATGEMSPREGALAAQWLGLDYVLPCHYIDPEHEDVREFEMHLETARARGERVPKSVVMRPGEILTL
jgi:L-ascorbate metabolism protein UlaG (beta-lactamase superfamily)